MVTRRSTRQSPSSPRSRHPQSQPHRAFRRLRRALHHPRRRLAQQLQHTAVTRLQDAQLVVRSESHLGGFAMTEDVLVHMREQLIGEAKDLGVAQ